MVSFELWKSGEQRSDVATELISVVFRPTMSTVGGGGPCTDASSSGGRKDTSLEELTGLSDEKLYCGRSADLPANGIAAGWSCDFVSAATFLCVPTPNKLCFFPVALARGTLLVSFPDFDTVVEE